MPSHVRNRITSSCYLNKDGNICASSLPTLIKPSFIIKQYPHFRGKIKRWSGLPEGTDWLRYIDIDIMWLKFQQLLQATTGQNPVSFLKDKNLHPTHRNTPENHDGWPLYPSKKIYTCVNKDGSNENEYSYCSFMANIVMVASFPQTFVQCNTFLV